jgi:hypothetical protein
MELYIDKTHRIKERVEGWIPQWSNGMCIWHNYTMMRADTKICGLELYSTMLMDVVFDTAEHATCFIKKAIEQEHRIEPRNIGTYYIAYDEPLPFGIKDW